METLENWQEKAEVLIEALPYIQRFRGKIIVVKYGGSAMVDHELKKSVIRDVALLKLVGFRPIIVHGGGKEITKWVNKAGLETNFVNGLRVTDKDTMEIAEMVLNKINKGLVSMMEKVGIHAVGISGKDGTTLKVDKKLSKGQDIGFVGEIKEVNTRLLEELLDNIVEMYCCPRQTQYVGKQPQTTKAIRLRLDKLTSQHVEYIFDVMSNTTQPIKNIMAYLRTTILNAPTTMEHYYQAQGNWLTAQSRKE